jgi:transposase-like protein
MARKVKENNSVSIKNDIQRWIINISVPVTISFPKTKNNTRLLYILLRMLCDMQGNRLLTYQAIAELIGFENRQNIHNFWSEFIGCAEDILSYLSRKVEFKKAIPLIQQVILSNILLPMSYQYETFRKKYPQYQMCYTTFVKYAGMIDSNAVLEETQKLFKKDSSTTNVEHLLQLIASQDKAPIICDKILEQVESKPQKTSNNMNKSRRELSLLVKYFVGSAMSYETIATLLNVSKATVHNLMYEVSDIKSLLINSISRWSGSISIDEKYIKINGVQHFVITIVDFATGLPLYWDIYKSLKKESYQQCFQMLKQLYGTPKLIVSDGSKPLAAAREIVFPRVRAQLCKFHKIRNLIKRLYECNLSEKEFEKCKKMIIKAFRRKTTSGRKKGIVKCANLFQPPAAEYLKNNVLSCWQLLCRSLTANSSERFNRKIEKVCSVRYGLQSIESANAIINALILKELINKGQKHLSEKSLIARLNISQLCQESIQWDSFGLLFSTKMKKAA